MSDGGAAPEGASGGGAQVQRIPVWLGPLALAVGSAFVLVAFILGRTELRYGDEGVATQATIVRLWVSESENSDGDTTYSYHVGYEFVEPRSGRDYRGSDDVGELRFLGLQVGDMIEVSYLESEPTESRLGTPEPQLLLPMAIGAFGGLMIVATPLLVISWFRERRMRRSEAFLPPATATDMRRVDVFTRSPIQAAGGPVALGAGAAFLVVGLFGLSQAVNMPSLLMLTLFGGVIGIGLIAGGVTSMRRGFGLRVAEVGPDGLWLLGLGRVAWADLDELRIEETRANRQRDDSTQGATSPKVTSRRLAVVPRDPAMVARRPDSLSRSLGRVFFGLLNAVRSDMRFVTESEQSPYGIGAGEIDQPFEVLVASVGRFTPVGTRIVQAMGETIDAAEAPPPRSIEPDRAWKDTELLEVDARLARREHGTRFVDGD